MNHFANVCQGGGFRKSSKPVHTLRREADTEGTGDDGQLFVGTLFIGDIQANDWQTKLRVNDTPVTFKLDTGAQANVLPVNVYPRIAILGKDACQSMNLVQHVRIDGVASHDSKPLTKEDLLTEYRDIFTGTGMFEKEYHIELDPSVASVIASVDEPNDWVHNLVITEKRNGSLRICLDPRQKDYYSWAIE